MHGDLTKKAQGLGRFRKLFLQPFCLSRRSYFWSGQDDLWFQMTKLLPGSFRLLWGRLVNLMSSRPSFRSNHVFPCSFGISKCKEDRCSIIWTPSHCAQFPDSWSVKRLRDTTFFILIFYLILQALSIRTLERRHYMSWTVSGQVQDLFHRKKISLVALAPSFGLSRCYHYLNM
jgi:hypothetical protein